MQMVLTACSLYNHQGRHTAGISTFCGRGRAIDASLNRILERLQRPVTKDRVWAIVAKRISNQDCVRVLIAVELIDRTATVRYFREGHNSRGARHAKLLQGLVYA